MRVTKEGLYATLAVGPSAMLACATRQTAQHAAESARREADLHQRLADAYAERATADFDHDDETARKLAEGCFEVADIHAKAHDVLIEHASEMDRFATFVSFWRRRPSPRRDALA